MHGKIMNELIIQTNGKSTHIVTDEPLDLSLIPASRESIVAIVEMGSVSLCGVIGGSYAEAVYLDWEDTIKANCKEGDPGQFTRIELVKYMHGTSNRDEINGPVYLGAALWSFCNRSSDAIPFSAVKRGGLMIATKIIEKDDDGLRFEYEVQDKTENRV